MPEVYLGIDVGSTALKAAAFDGASGRALAWRAVRIPLQTGADGRRQQRPADLDRALVDTLTTLRRAVGRRWSQLCGVGLAAQGGSGLIVDEAGGKALTPMALWNDARSQAQLAEVARRRPPSFWRKATWRPGPGQGLARMLWFESRRPGLLSDGRLYVGAGEYLYFRLTGRWRQDPCNALQIGCFNVPRRRIDPTLLAVVGQTPERVAPLREGHRTHPVWAAAARGLMLPEGAPVAGPYMDHEAGYLSSLGVSERPLQCSLGTAWVGNFALPDTERWQCPTHLVLPSAAREEDWLVIQPLLTGNVTWDWALTTLLEPDHGKALAASEAVFRKALLAPPGLTALPWLNVAHPLESGLRGGGAFFGMSPETNRRDLLRAVAAAMVYEMRWIFSDVLHRDKVDGLVLGGGACKGKGFRRLFGALFAEVPVYAAAEEDLIGTRGALHVFGRRLSQARAEKIRRAGPTIRRAIEADYRRYVTLRNALYGHVAAGGPLLFD